MASPAFTGPQLQSKSPPAPTGVPGYRLQRKCKCGQHTTGGSQCDECEKKDSRLQRSALRATEASPVPASVYETVRAPGQPLETATRSFMESRFGHDFSHVRIHTDATAAESAQAVSALAYTVGRDVVFGAGRYRPQTEEGRKLIAHELAHTVQQSSLNVLQQESSLTVAPADDPAAAQSPLEWEADQAAAAVTAGRAASVSLSLGTGAVQRQVKPPAPRVDVAIVLDDDKKNIAEAHSYASTVLLVASPEDARDQLKALGKPIGTLYVVGHGVGAGEVQFSIDTIRWVPISSLGDTLKKGFAPGMEPVSVDFRACRVGAAGRELESFRSAVGAQSAKGTNCYTFTNVSIPLISPEGEQVTKPGQIPASMQKKYDQILLKQLDMMKADNGVPVKNCLSGLAAGEAASAANLKKIWSLYFANDGELVAAWASPENDKNWQKGSICMKDMTESTQPCSVVEKKAPPASGTTPPEGSGTTTPAVSGRR